jgi:hypothetical protein
MSAVAVAKKNEWLGRAADISVPPEYATTDRICQRWAVSIGMGLPTEIWQEAIKSRPPPLDDDTAIIVDQLILKSPEKTKRLVRGWYCTNQPNSILADRLKLSERTLVTAWHLSLHFLRYRFSESGHRGVLALLRLRD